MNRNLYPFDDIVSPKGSSMNVEQIDNIFATFDSKPHKYNKAGVDEIVSYRETCTPRLIAILEEVAATPEIYQNECRMRHLYAAIILGYFKEPQAHVPLIKAFTTNGDNDFWGDMVTEDLDRLLFQTCNDDFSAIKKLIADKSMDVYVRCAAINALNMAVAKGIVARTDVIALYSSIFRDAENDVSSDLLTILTSAIVDICPKELLSTFRDAYEDGLIWSGYISFEEIKDIAKAGIDESLEKLKKRTEKRIHENIHDYMSWWACFQPKQKECYNDKTIKNRSQHKDRDKEKNKKRIAKKSKKRNRR